MKFQLPHHKKCRYEGGTISVGRTAFHFDDIAELFRIFLTCSPLIPNDPRLALVDELRGAVTMKESNGRQWLTFPLRAQRTAALKL